MNIMLFGMSNVGKTSAAKRISELLDYKFFDLDEEVKKYYNTTIEEFVKHGTRYDRDMKRSIVIKNILNNSAKNKIISMTPMYYSRAFNKFLKQDDVLAIELQDTVENIFDRLVFSDENDVIYTDDEYKNKYKDHYMFELIDEKQYYKQSFSKIKNKYFMDGRNIEETAKDLIVHYNLAKIKD